jgi:hypothetical protein
MGEEIFSRPARLGASITGDSEESVVHLFTEKRILIRLEARFLEIADARESFLFAVNLCLRFCSNICVCVEGRAAELIRNCDSLAARIHGPAAKVEIAQKMTSGSFDAVVNVGTEVFSDLPSATINSSGWVARLATAGAETPKLYWILDTPNAVGALAATCLGVGAAFFAILGRPLTSSLEISLFNHEVAAPGTLAPGPPLPVSPLNLDAFLVGCGAVTNGWAYAVKRLPIMGRLQAIDRQSLRLENIWSYVAVGCEGVGEPKALLIKELLSPAINVTERPDQWEFFKIWLDHGLEVPPLIIAGLDNVTTRHSVQRLWPETLIDMAAEKLQSQVIVKHRKGDGLCLLRALSIPSGEVDWAQNLARATGLNPTLIANEPTGEITQEEIEVAPVDKQAGLRAALGKPRCGHINRLSLEMEGYAPDFAPAVPFVTAFSGVVGAAETMKWLMGQRYSDSLHFQRSFASGRSRALKMKCAPNCECQARSCFDQRILGRQYELTGMGEQHEKEG